SIVQRSRGTRRSWRHSGRPPTWRLNSSRATRQSPGAPTRRSIRRFASTAFGRDVEGHRRWRAPPMTAPAPEGAVGGPSLNEGGTGGTGIEKAEGGFRDHQMQGEIIVADNGSTDGSQAIAERLGARVINVTERGYGSALMGGIAEARGPYVIMGDADDSYDF